MVRNEPLIARDARVFRPGGHPHDERVLLAVEEPLAVTLNGRRVAVLMRLAGLEKELAAGFCVSEGLIGGADDLLLVEHCGQGIPAPGEDAEEQEGPSRNRVRVRARPEGIRSEAQLDVIRLIRAGCGRTDALAALDLPPLADGPCFQSELLLGLATKLREAQRLHRASGGLHAAGLFDREGRMVAVAEDVGRHNALDKVAGHCLLRRIALDDKLALCSGRLSYEMAAKAVRLRLPLLMSVTAPTALAAEAAEAHNLTLVGYARGGHMTVYCHPERVALTA